MAIPRGILIFFLIVVVSCVEREQLTFEKTPYDGSKLRLNGFYYLHDSSGLNVPVYFFLLKVYWCTLDPICQRTLKRLKKDFHKQH